MPGLRKLHPVTWTIEEISKRVKVFPVSSVPTTSSVGSYVAEDVLASADVPPVDKAVLDGFAVNSEDVEDCNEASPCALELCEKWSPGCAVPVNTGTPVPEGADTVVPIEACKVEGTRVYVYKPFPPGNAISKRGEDLKKGDIIISKGTYIRPWHVAAMLSQGIVNVKIVKPRIALAATGSELVEPWEEGGVKNTTAWLIASFLKERLGVEPTYFGIIEDNKDEILKYFKENLENYDVVITTGGTSVGRADFSAKALEEVSDFSVHGVALTPGRPLAIGVKDGKLLVALSGYPVAALSEMEVVVWNVFKKAWGLVEPPRPKVKGKLTRRLPVQPNMVHVYRVLACEAEGEVYVEPLRLTGSGILSSLLRGNGILVAGMRGETGYDVGAEVEVELISPLRPCNNKAQRAQ